MIMGAEVLVIPLTRIGGINSSFAEGKFSDLWKEDIVTPALKKEVQKEKNVYFSTDTC